jgi:putative polyketide hydroxylase
MMKHLIQTEVVVVGGGPVGLTAAMLLEKFKIGYVVLEKNKSLRTHPSAHWINIRTKEIFA